jgi:hypothetical protein
MGLNKNLIIHAYTNYPLFDDNPTEPTPIRSIEVFEYNGKGHCAIGLYNDKTGYFYTTGIPCKYIFQKKDMPEMILTREQLNSLLKD